MGTNFAHTISALAVKKDDTKERRKGIDEEVLIAHTHHTAWSQIDRRNV